MLRTKRGFSPPFGTFETSELWFRKPERAHYPVVITGLLLDGNALRMASFAPLIVSLILCAAMIASSGLYTNPS
jgi:hypothetical protein